MFRSRGARARAFIASLIIALAPDPFRRSADAQQPNGPPAPVYHPPVIVLAAPSSGETVPADKPVVVLRFAAGEATDAVDPSSFRAIVDGRDQTRLFQLGSGEAWGPLARDTLSQASSAIAPGVHLLHVRLCSVRGVCAALDAPVTVIPVESAVSPATVAAADSAAQHRGRSVLQRLLDFALAGARKLLAP